jgi:ribosomal protein L11 methyltransferase
VLHGNILTDEGLAKEIGTGYDVIVANIVADVIIAMSEFFKLALKPSGTLITSGIIDSRAGEVETALQDVGFTQIEVFGYKGWVAIIGKGVCNGQ